MEGEINNYIKVWIAVFVSLCYCYTMGRIIPKGLTRLLSILPVVCLFFYLPLNLITIHLCGTTAFFIGWLGNFKLLLFAFGKGPLSADPSISLSHFIAVGCLPIKIQHNPPPNLVEKHQNNQNPSPNTQNGKNPSPKITPKGPKSPLLNYTIKALLLVMIVRIYDYSDKIHPTVILILICFHIYFCLEFILAIVAAMARTLLGLELEPQFDEPYLSTSLQDFWGRRWNIMVTSILHPTVYDPILYLSSGLVGRKWAPLPAVLGTFGVSALMHELIFNYIGRVNPTWESTWFFFLHGFCLTVELALKKNLKNKFQLHPLISGPLTVGFVIVTGLWLFLPELLRCNAYDRAFEEYAAVGTFVKDIGRALTLTVSASNATRA